MHDVAVDNKPVHPAAAPEGDTIATSCVPPAQPFAVPSVHVNDKVVSALEAGLAAVTAVGAADGVNVLTELLATEATEFNDVSLHVRETVNV